MTVASCQHMWPHHPAIWSLVTRGASDGCLVVDDPPGLVVHDPRRPHHGGHRLHPRTLARRPQRLLLHERREVPRRGPG